MQRILALVALAAVAADASPYYSHGRKSVSRKGKKGYKQPVTRRSYHGGRGSTKNPSSGSKYGGKSRRRRNATSYEGGSKDGSDNDEDGGNPSEGNNGDGSEASVGGAGASVEVNKMVAAISVAAAAIFAAAI